MRKGENQSALGFQTIGSSCVEARAMFKSNTGTSLNSCRSGVRSRNADISVASLCVCVCVCICLSVIISLCSGLFLCTVMQYIGFVGVLFST